MIASGFNSAQKSFCLGLARLDHEYRLIDYNAAAKRLIDFPRRGVFVCDMLYGGKASLNKLGKRVGDSVVVSFLIENRHLNTVAFRERGGSVLLFFHPLLATLKLGNSNKSFAKILSFYSGNILSVLTEMGAPKGTVAYRYASIPDKVYYSDLETNNLYTAKRSIETLVRKLQATNFKKKITIAVDGAPYDNTVGINILVLQYSMIELFSALQIYGEGENTSIRIGMVGDALRISLFDKLNRKLNSSDTYYARVFTEFLKLIDVGSKIEFKETGELNIEVYIPVMANLFELGEAVPDDTWDIFYYCMDYYGFGDDQDCVE